MEKKYYQIGTQTPEDWSIVHELLMKDGTLEDNIPSRSVECANEILHSPTRSTYLMTDEEAELLKNDSRILFVNLDPRYHKGVEPICEPLILKYNRNVKNYRNLRKSTGPSTYQFGPPITDYDGRSSGEFYRTGYQILRCAQKDNPWPSDPSTVLNRDVDYLYDGRDVDLVVVDNGTFFGHPEFVWDEYSPPNYIRGNVLSRSGLCGVLDLALDAPYYLDPEWFDANPSARLTRRWDGTIVPVEQVARDWWRSAANRSSSFPNFGVIYVPPEYTRANHCGANRTTRPSNQVGGDHGTPCASLAYGKNFGWAFNANKWSLAVRIGLLGNYSNAMTVEEGFNIVKVFHLHKPNNPKFGTKDPTISSNSYGSSEAVPDVSGSYSYQNGPAVTLDPHTRLTGLSFLTNRFAGYNHSMFYNVDFSFVVAGRELIDAGVIFCVAAGNDGRYLANPTDDNFNNYWSPAEWTPRASAGSINYSNRPGWPAQIGYIDGDTRYKSFVIGAIDDEYTGAYVEPDALEVNPVYLSTNDGKERLARLQDSGNSVATDYTNRGTGIDFYAPADGTLAASHRTDITSGSTFLPVYQNPYQVSTTMRFNDRYMNGTSAACPVFAGLAACFMQNNRGLTALQLKTYLRNNIENQSYFFLGPTPTSAYDENWYRVPFSTMGTPVKLIYQFAATTATPNPTFTPNYGILSSSSVNERFTITHSSSLRNTLGIYGIQMFSNTISSGTSITLQIANGYYLVGSANRIDGSGNAARDSDGTSFGSLNQIAIRVDPTNNKKVQLSDSNGSDTWDDMEITVQNGTFQKVGTQVYYVFTGGSLASFPTPSTPLPPTPTVTPVIPLGTYYVPPPGGGGTPPGSGAIVGGGNMSISGDIVAGGNITGLVSDERLKTNQKEINNALEKLEKLNGFTYNFNDIAEGIGFDKNKRHSGVSAQDVNEVLPEAVAPAPADNDYLTVKYDKLIPLLIEAVKDLKNDIDEIKDNDNK